MINRCKCNVILNFTDYYLFRNPLNLHCIEIIQYAFILISTNPAVMKNSCLIFLAFIPVFCFAQFPGGLPNPMGAMSNPYLSKGLKKVAAHHLDKSKAEYDTTSFNYAISLSDDAGLYENEEKWQRNKKLFSDYLKQSAGETRTPTEEAEQYNEVGQMMYASSKFAAAETSFLTAKKVYESVKDSSEDYYGKVLANLGILYQTTGRYSKAEEYDKKALDLIQKNNAGGTIANSAAVNNLGLLYKDMGKYTEAEKLLNQAMQLSEINPGKKSAAYAITLNNQAMLFEEMGRFQQAEHLLEEAIHIASEVMTEKSTNYQRLLINQALLYQEMSKYEQAEAIYKKAIHIKEQRLGTSHPDYAHLLNLEAELFMLMNKTTEVENLLKKAADIYLKRFGSNHPSYASVLYNLGNYYRINNKSAEAYTNLNKALSIRISALGEKHPATLQSKESIAILNWQNNKISDAASGFKAVLDEDMVLINEYFAPLSEAEKARFWDKMHPHFDHYAAFVTDVYKHVPEIAGDFYNYQLSTKALLLNSSNKIRQQILNSGDADLIKQYKDWMDAKENLSRLYALSKAELSEQKINLDSLEDATNDKEKKLSERSNIFRTGYSISTVTWKDIQAALGSDDAAIELIHITKFNRVQTDTIYYTALILTKEMPLPQIVVLTNGNQLEKRYFSYYRNSIRGKTPDDMSYKQYWEEIDKICGTKKSVYVSQDGIYSQINLSTLRTNEGGYLLDKKNFILVSNTKDILKLKTANTKVLPLTATLIGNPVFGNTGSVAALPGTKAEIESIRIQLSGKSYKVSTFIQNDASEQNIRKVNNPKILHIATHGFFVKEAEPGDKTMGIESDRSSANPMLRSGILLANAEEAINGKSEFGILTAYEAMNLNLDQTEIVVLSACETGLGDVKNGEGVYGLQRAFLVAGVDAIMMSLWKVNDEATQKLMSSFYKNYLLLNDKQKAFKAAQNELKTVYKDPYYWGAFVMVQ